jgi:hypothetical protein
VTSSPAEDTAPAPTPVTTTPSTGTSFVGRPDLAITNIARTEGQSALSFTAYNLGSRSTGNWYFSYTDAENPGRTLISPLQPNLNPGQGLLIQVRFDSQENRNQTVSVFLDSTYSINESNEGNNTASVIINGDRNGGGRSFNRNDDADLVIEDLEVGRISGNRFVEDDDIDEDDDAAIRFTVRNRGGESTGSWRFEIENTPNDDDYRSNRQGSLRPGESREYVIEFENPDEGSYNIRVDVDSSDDVDEEDERNNDEAERLRVRD